MRADPNYIADRNPFSLAKPPSWWLRGLHRFDPDLVLLPSRRKPVFVLARRRRFSRAGLAGALDRKLHVDDPANTLHSHMCDSYGFVFVTTIFSTHWTTANLDVMCDELRRRDTWTLRGGKPLTQDDLIKAAFEGGSQLTREIDAHDAAQRQRIDQQEHDACYHATGDAWRSRQARTGERILNAGRPSTLRRRIATPKPLPVRPLIGV